MHQKYGSICLKHQRILVHQHSVQQKISTPCQAEGLITSIYFRKIWDFDITGVPNFVNFSDGTAKALYRVRLLEFNFSGCSSSNFLHQQIILSPKEMVYLLQIFILS